MSNNITNRQLVHEIINNFDENQLEQVIKILESVKSLTENERDDKFCKALYENYLNDQDPNKHDVISIEDFARELNIKI